MSIFHVTGRIQLCGPCGKHRAIVCESCKELKYAVDFDLYNYLQRYTNICYDCVNKFEAFRNPRSFQRYPCSTAKDSWLSFFWGEKRCGSKYNSLATSGCYRCIGNFCAVHKPLHTHYPVQLNCQECKMKFTYLPPPPPPSS
jgi:hypothetical protein